MTLASVRHDGVGSVSDGGERVVAAALRSRGGGLVSTAALVLAAECALAFVHVKLDMGLLPLLALHVAIVVALAGHSFGPWTVHVEGGSPPDRTGPMLLAIAALAAGPIGAAVVLVGAVLPVRRADSTPLLAAWYKRIALASEIDATTELCDTVASGRTMDLAAPVPRAFMTVIERGTLAERQTSLGLIARRFHPQYLPALEVALRSAEPVVRVQAAAVAARVRGPLRARLEALLSDDWAGRADASASRRAELEAILASGLVEAGARDKARAALAAQAVSLGPDAGAAAAQVSSRFKALRGERLRRQLAARGTYRVRPLPRRRARTGRSS